MTTLDALIGRLPVYAAELGSNFEALVRRDRTLTDEQRWGTLVSCAMVARCGMLTAAVLAEAEPAMRPEALAAARMAAAMMSLTNGFYRFDGLSGLQSGKAERAGLRVGTLRRQRGVVAEDFALWCLAVSVANGCAACVQAQERTLAALGSAPERALAVRRLGALVGALAVVCDADQAAGKKPAGA